MYLEGINEDYVVFAVRFERLEPGGTPNDGCYHQRRTGHAQPRILGYCLVKAGFSHK